MAAYVEETIKAQANVQTFVEQTRTHARKVLEKIYPDLPQKMAQAKNYVSLSTILLIVLIAGLQRNLAAWLMALLISVWLEWGQTAVMDRSVEPLERSLRLTRLCVYLAVVASFNLYIWYAMLYERAVVAVVIYVGLLLLLAIPFVCFFVVFRGGDQTNRRRKASLIVQSLFVLVTYPLGLYFVYSDKLLGAVATGVLSAYTTLAFSPFFDALSEQILGKIGPFSISTYAALKKCNFPIIALFVLHYMADNVDKGIVYFICRKEYPVIVQKVMNRQNNFTFLRSPRTILRGGYIALFRDNVDQFYFVENIVNPFQRQTSNDVCSVFASTQYNCIRKEVTVPTMDVSYLKRYDGSCQYVDTRAPGVNFPSNIS